MNIYISPSGRPHVTLEKNGKRYAFWPLFNKLEELSKQVPPEVKRVVGATVLIDQPSKDGYPNIDVTCEGFSEKGKSLAAELAADWHSDEQKDISVNQAVSCRTVGGPTPVFGSPAVECDVVELHPDTPRIVNNLTEVTQ